MKYFQIILLTICTACISYNLSAQSTHAVPNPEDQERVYISKSNLLKKVKENIERIQSQNPDDDEDNDQETKKSIKPISNTEKAKKPLKAKLPKKDN